ncbi:MAG: hypothetical protein ACLQUT_13395 [Thermoleophilia bacterium]
MSHADETLTDVYVRRLSVATGAGYVAFGWDYPGATLLEVRVVRSQRGFARTPDDPARPLAQHIVYQGDTGSFRDAEVEQGARYYYTVFARHSGEPEWTLWEQVEATVGRNAQALGRNAKLAGRGEPTVGRAADPSGAPGSDVAGDPGDVSRRRHRLRQWLQRLRARLRCLLR